MDANCAHEITDTSDETLQFISDLIHVSRTDEQMIYREAEIDELWRLLDFTRASASGDTARALAAKISVVMEVHDMLEETSNAQRAAQRLRGLAAHRA